MNADDFLDAPDAEDFLSDAAPPAPKRLGKLNMGRGNAPVRPPAPAPVSVLETIPPDPGAFDFRRAATLSRQLQDNQDRQAQYGTIGPIVGPKPSIESVARGVFTDLVAGGKNARAGISQAAADILPDSLGAQVQADLARKERGQAALMTAVNTPQFESSTAQGLYSGLSSTVRQLPSIAAGIVTRNPEVALGGMVAPMVPEEYGKYRERGATPLQALPAALGQAGVEYITEKLPMGVLVNQFGRVGAGRMLTEILAREVPGEQLATIVQDAIDTATANPNKTWGDYLRERPDAAYQTLLATLTQSGIMAGASGVTRRVDQAATANELAGAINADAQDFANRAPPQMIWQPEQPRVAPPVAAPVAPEPAAPPALPYDPTVQQPDTGIMVAGQDGAVRPMTADEFLDAEDVRQQALDTGLTPDVRRAQAARAASADITDVEPKAPDENSRAPRGTIAAPAQADQGAAPDGAPAGPVAAEDGAAGARGMGEVAQPAELTTHPDAQPDVVAQDLERLYQQDVKDSIRERLGIAPRAEEEIARAGNTEFIRFLREQGLSSEAAQDIYGDNAFKANRALPGVFRKGGMQLDELVARAVERGFMNTADVESALDTGGVRKLTELIQRQIRGDAPTSIGMAGDRAAEAVASRARQDLEQRAAAIGFDGAGLDDAKLSAALARIDRRRSEALVRKEQFDAREEARMERLAIQDEAAFTPEQLDALDGDWLAGDNVTLADAMMALGFDPAEIDTYAARQEANRRGAETPDGAAPGAEARAGAADEGSQALESYSPAEVVDRQERAAEAQRREQRDQQQADQRAAADRQRGDFTLTGSDRAADANPGQGDLQFRRSPARRPAASTADTLRTELRARFGDVIDRLEKRGFLKLWDSIQQYNESGQFSQLPDEASGAAQGMYSHKTGIAHLFGDGIQPGTAVGVLLHEVGEHASMKAMLGEKRYRDLVRQAYALARSGDEVANTAMDRIPEDTPDKFFDSELLAYMIEETANRENASPAARSWLRDIIAAIRAWFYQTGFAKRLDGYGVKLEMTPKDIAALAERAVRWQAEQGGKEQTDAAGEVDIALSKRPPVSPTGSNANTVSSAAQPWTVAEPGTWDNVVRQMQNNKIDLKRVREAIERQFGRIPDAADAYLQEELYHGKVAARVEKLHTDYVEPILRKIAVAGEAHGVTIDDVNNYLHAMHAPERNAAMSKINPTMPNNQALSGMTDADAAKVLRDFGANGKLPALQAIGRDVYQLLGDTRTALVADGLEEASTVQAWEQAYKHYVPLMRDVGDRPARGSGVSVRGPEAKRAVGSNRQAVNILANVVTQAETAAIRAEKAEVGRALLQMAQQYPNADFWKVDTPPVKPRIDPNTGLVQRNAVDPLYQTADNVVMVKDYGATRFIVFNEDSERAAALAKAMKNLDIQRVPRAIEYFGRATRFMASLLTQRNPEFWFTNFSRDLQGSMIQMSGTDAEGLQAKVFANLPKAMAGMRHVARNTGAQTQWARYAQELKDAGGTTGYMQMFENSDARMKDLQKEVDRMQQGAADPRRLARQMIEFIDDYNDVVENGMRLAVFQAAREAGVSTERAASIAKNITVNFNRKGNATPLVNSLYMFFNAGLQGSARLAQALATSPKARIAVGTMATVAFIMDIVNRAIAGDDDETKRNRYDMIPESEKARNWIFMLPGGKYVKVPLPIGFNIFHNAGRLMADAIFRKDPRNASEYGWAFASTLLDAFSPLGQIGSLGQALAPSVLRPAVQLAENKSAFGGKVYKSADQGFGKIDPKPAYTRHFDSTPDFWKAASKTLNDATGGDKVKPGWFNIEPDILRFIYGTMTGGPGRALDKTVDTAQAKARGEDVSAARLPFAARFYGSNDDRQKDAAYYEDLRRAEKAKTQFDYFMKQGRRDLALEVLKELGQGDVAKGRQVIAEYNRAKKDDRVINRRLRQLAEQADDGKDTTEQMTELKQRKRAGHRRVLSATGDDGEE